MGMHVPGRDARDAESLGDPRQPPVASAIVAQERALQLDPQMPAPERFEQAPQRELVADAAKRTPAQANKPLRVIENLAQRHPCLRWRSRLFTRVRVGARQDPAQVRPAPRVLDEQRQVATVLEIDLRTVDRAQAERPRGHGELHRTRDRVVVGQRKRFIAQLERSRHELVGKRGAVQERESRVAVELDVHRRTYVPIRSGHNPASGGLSNSLTTY